MGFLKGIISPFEYLDGVADGHKEMGVKEAGAWWSKAVFLLCVIAYSLVFSIVGLYTGSGEGAAYLFMMGILGGLIVSAFTILGVKIASWIYAKVGSWFGGEMDSKLLYPNLYVSWGLGVAVNLVVVVLSMIISPLAFVLGLVPLVASFIYTGASISATQRISAGKGVVSAIIGFLAIMILIGIIAFMFGLVATLFGIRP